MVKNIFDNYKTISDRNRGKVTPIEVSNEGKTLRLKLDNKDLIVDTEKDIVYLQDSYLDTLIEVLGRPNNLKAIIDSVIQLTFRDYHYSLNNLKQSI